MLKEVASLAVLGIRFLRAALKLLYLVSDEAEKQWCCDDAEAMSIKPPSLSTVVLAALCRLRKNHDWNALV